MACCVDVDLNAGATVRIPATLRYGVKPPLYRTSLSPRICVPLYSGLATGIFIFLFAEGRELFSSNFWEGFNEWMLPGRDVFLFSFPIYAGISFVFSIGVVFIYRLRKI
jgi:hypothetical protein